MISGMFSEEGGDLSLEFWSAWWKEEEIIQEKGKKSIKVAPLYGSFLNSIKVSIFLNLAGIEFQMIGSKYFSEFLP